MVNTFIDVQNGHWAYDYIQEAANTTLYDGTPLVEAIPYQVFEDGKPRIYEEIKAKKDQINFTLSKKVTPTASNPLYVFLNGVQYSYKSVKNEGDKTVVTLNQAVKENTTVSFLSPGVPKKDERGRPEIKSNPFHPHYMLKHGSSYKYFSGGGNNEYLTVFGKQLKRAVIADNDLDAGHSEQVLARKYIGMKNDRYIVAPNGRLMLPHMFEGMGGTITYYTQSSSGTTTKRTEEFKAYSGTASDTSTDPYFTDRFFPESPVLRWEAIDILDRLRRYYFENLTDTEPPGPNLDQEITAFTGQRVFKMDTQYRSGEGNLTVEVLEVNEGESTWKLLKEGEDYEEFDDVTVLMKRPQENGTVLRFRHEKTQSNHLVDVGRNGTYTVDGGSSTMKVNGTTEDWVKAVLSLEHEQLNDGTRLINGKGVEGVEVSGSTYKTGVTGAGLKPAQSGSNGVRMFMPYTTITRDEMAAFTNRLRKWFVERFQ